jgi:uncharacterized protein
MKRNLRKWTNLVCFACALSFTCEQLTAQESSNEADCRRFRDSLNLVFKTPGLSILDSSQLSSFEGIPFFAYDNAYCVMAKMKRIKNGKPIEMLTSGARRPIYMPIAEARFRLNGQKQKLTLYVNQNPSKPEYANHVMLAFSDLTNGFETYGGGRYLDFELKDIHEDMVIDFNFAYNPYCAYVDRFACVIPPTCNRMNTAIRAGARIKEQNHQ